MITMRISKSAFGLAICALTALVAAACGGGGGSATPAIAHPHPSPTGATCKAALSPALMFAGISGHVNQSLSKVSVGIGPGPASRVCPPAKPGIMECKAWLRSDVRRDLAAGPAGYAPADLQTAYGLTSDSSSGGVGQTVAIVDAFDDPNAEADLATYRTTFGLPACTTGNGCFKKVNEHGNASPLPGTDPTGGWEAEESLDLDMVSAICPNCHIVLFEAASAISTDFFIGEDTAAATPGVTIISNSWGTSEYTGENSDDSHFNHPGIMITASAGDSGYDGPGSGFPSASAHVTSVGGTTLQHVGSTWPQKAWSGTGSLCSQFVVQPSWQAALGAAYTSICSTRIDNDVSAVADPNTGVAVYDTFGGSAGCTAWCVAGGTSASSPIIASVYAIAGNGATLTYGSNAYANTGSLTDVTTGSNNSVGGGTFLCNGIVGFDGPTGLGTPIGTGAF